jgi:hypothetical protein
VRTFGDIDPLRPGLSAGAFRAPTTNLGTEWEGADGSAPMGSAQLERQQSEPVPLRGDRVDLDQARQAR